jgi:hypothetical protein
MTDLKNTKYRILRNVISCVLYILALSIVLVLFGITEDIVFKKHSPSLDDPGYWIEQFQNNVHSFIFYIIKNLSLKKLFALTFVCIVINHYIERLITSPAYTFWAILLSIVIAYVVPVLILFLFSVKKRPSSGFEAQMQQQKVDDLKSKYIKYWYVLDILLIMVVIFWGSLLDPFGLVNYISGLYNNYTLFFSGFTYALLIVPASLCILVLIIRMIVSWPKYISNRRKLRLIQIIILLCLFMYLILPFLPIMPTPKRIYIAGFEGYVKNNTDIEEIRNWLNSLNQEDFTEYKSKKNVKWREKINWPGAILELHPRVAELSWDKNYKTQIELSWGSGVVGPWGFVVRSENIPIPESEISYPGEYRNEIQNGVYVWCRSN